MSVSISAKTEKIFRYAYASNHVPFIKQLRVTAGKACSYRNLTLEITSVPEIFEPFTYDIEELKEGQSKEISPVLAYNASLTASLTEACSAQIWFRVLEEGRVIKEKNKEITVAPLDESSNYSKDRAGCVAYVTPHALLVGKIVERAAAIRKSVVGYKDGKDNVRSTVEAVYQAIVEEQIPYVLLNINYESGYQRIQTLDSIAVSKRANCIEMTYLFASALEALSLNPIIFFIKGHAFAGVWLTDNCMEQPVSYDIEFFRKKTAADVDEILAIEATCACSYNQASFSSACKSAVATLNEKQNSFEAVDIVRARKGGIRPIPTANAIGELTQKEISLPVHMVGYTQEKQPEKLGDYQIPERYERWMNDLMDSSARSTLVNIPMRSSSTRACPVLLPKGNAAAFYRAFIKGEEWRVSERPADFEGSREQELYELYNKADALGSILANGLNNNLLYLNVSDATRKKLTASLVKETEEAKRQRGVQILYLALGTLRWEEKKIRHYAPLLLIPVTLEKEGCSICLRYSGGEIQFNEAILSLLRSRFDIRRPKGLCPVPKSANGTPDLTQIVHALRVGLEKENHLQVYEDHAVLGLFDYGTYALWRDLQKNKADFSVHPVIRSILRGVWEEENGTERALKTEEELLLPYDLDHSQIQAILSALAELSFILIGPPGTGKTMTLISMILNLIVNSRSVLFSAEKTAALEVAYDRLKKYGLEPFFLYVPAANGKPSDVLGQLKLVMEQAEEFADTADYETEQKELLAQKRKIEMQTALLHRTRICGMSLYQLISWYIPLAPHRPDLVLDESFMERLSAENIAGMKAQLKQLGEAGTAIGHPHGHCLASWPDYECRLNLGEDLHRELERYIYQLTEVDNAAAVLAKNLEHASYDGTADSTRALLPKKCDTKERLIALIPREFLKYRHLIEVVRAAAAYKHYQQKKQEYRAQYGKMAEANGEKLAKLRQDYLTGGMLEKSRIRKNILQIVGHPMEEAQILKMLSDLSRFLNQPAVPVVETETELSAEELLQLALSLEKVFGSSEELRAQISALEESHRYLQLSEELRSAWKDLQGTVDALHALIPGLSLWSDGSVSTEQALEQARQWMSTGLIQLKEWKAYQAERSKCVNAGLEKFVDLYENGLSEERLLPSFEAAVYHALICRIYDKNQEVREFTGSSFLRMVERFQELDRGTKQLAAQEIRCRMLKKIAKALNEDTVLRKEAVILRKLSESGGRNTSIRQILNTYLPNLSRLLTPCFMMSPAAAAEYLEGSYTFDTTIFDEASQIQTAKSIGAIARGSQLIVTGDPMQLPPTSFFVTSDDYDDLEVTEQEQESILGECRALGFKKVHLTTHYRSVSESLITFCNAKYYDGMLTTFPSADGRTSRVEYHQVNGIYDRGATRTNKEEAEGIVRLLEHRLTEGDRRSYGVIAFHANQQALIQRMVDKRATENPVFAEALSQMKVSGKELFIRNLENVQGDEADVIIFSCAYGKDKDGAFSMNFGPLNQEQAHRRLNVAFSRSREEMHIFCSFSPDELRLTASSSRGLCDLRDFLLYAKGTLTAQALSEEKKETANRKNTDGFQKQICEYLDSMNLKYDCSVGNSDCQVDIAVVDPKDEGRYVLGILLNNENYYRNGRNCYDREVGRNEQLKARGWKLLRIFSNDYWDYREVTHSRILAALGEGNR